MGLLQGRLEEDTGLLTMLDGIKRAARDWAANAKASSWLAHNNTDRLRAAERLLARPDLAANLEPTDRAYVAACQREESTASWRRVRVYAAVFILLLGVGGATATFARWFPIADAVVYRVINMRVDLAKPGAVFRDCFSCPEMVVTPSGSFIRRLGQRGIAHLEQTVHLLARTLRAHGLVRDEGEALLDVVTQYARSCRSTTKTACPTSPRIPRVRWRA